MRYSFITPRKKSFFTLFTRIWIVFIFSVVLILALFNFFVLFKVYDFKDDAKLIDIQRVQLEKKIDGLDKQIGFILRQKAIVEDIYANNLMLKDSIKNLFDLVPDTITLNRVLMEKDSLIIYGVTPTKDAYNFLLAAPLKSIFHTSNAVFYLTKEGWYNFISTNKIITSDLNIVEEK